MNRDLQPVRDAEVNMKNTLGSSVCVTLFGESHGAKIGAVLDGMAPGIPVDEDLIRHQLDLRRPAGRTGTARRETDAFEIVSGVFEGKTTGTPIAILIPNADTRSGDYARGALRPGHADYTAQMKYHGFEDYRGTDGCRRGCCRRAAEQGNPDRNTCGPVRRYCGRTLYGSGTPD